MQRAWLILVAVLTGLPFLLLCLVGLGLAEAYTLAAAEDRESAQFVSEQLANYNGDSCANN